MKNLKFSIVIPAHNEEHYISNLLTSLQKQDFKGMFEVIVVDNASTDKTAEVAKARGVRVVKESRKGLPQARETGRMAATGEIVIFLDADMIIPSNYLSILNQVFSSNDGIIGTTNLFTFYDGNTWQDIAGFIFARIIYPCQTLILKTRGLQNQLLGGNFAIRARVLNSVGGFDLDTDFEGDDLGITKKISHLGKIVLLPHLYTKTSARRFSTRGTLQTSWFYIKEFFNNLENPKKVRMSASWDSLKSKFAKRFL